MPRRVGREEAAGGGQRVAGHAGGGAWWSRWHCEAQVGEELGARRSRRRRFGLWRDLHSEPPTSTTIKASTGPVRRFLTWRPRPGRTAAPCPLLCHSFLPSSSPSQNPSRHWSSPLFSLRRAEPEGLDELDVRRCIPGSMATGSSGARPQFCE